MTPVTMGTITTEDRPVEVATVEVITAAGITMADMIVLTTEDTIGPTAVIKRRRI
jgi:hypothetical protein